MFYLILLFCILTLILLNKIMFPRDYNYSIPSHYSILSILQNKISLYYILELFSILTLKNAR